MKKLTLAASVLMAAMSLVSCAEKQNDGEWISLFDGETFEGWRGYHRTDMPAAWTIEDGAIKINGLRCRRGGRKRRRRHYLRPKVQEFRIGI